MNDWGFNTYDEADAAAEAEAMMQAEADAAAEAEMAEAEAEMAQYDGEAEAAEAEASRSFSKDEHIKVDVEQEIKELQRHVEALHANEEDIPRKYTEDEVLSSRLEEAGTAAKDFGNKLKAVSYDMSAVANQITALAWTSLWSEYLVWKQGRPPRGPVDVSRIKEDVKELEPIYL